jgi:hypothetical protein
MFAQRRTPKMGSTASANTSVRTQSRDLPQSRDTAALESRAARADGLAVRVKKQQWWMRRLSAHAILAAFRGLGSSFCFQFEDLGCEVGAVAADQDAARRSNELSNL